MSTPFQDHRANGGPLSYAPKRALSEQNHPGASGRVKEPGTAPEFSEPPWQRKGEPAFSGDIANVVLRKRLAESCEEIPVPFLVEVPRARRPFRRFLGAVALVGVGVIGYWWGSGQANRTPGPNLGRVSDRAEMTARRSPPVEIAAPSEATRVDIEPTQDSATTRSIGAAGGSSDATSAGVAKRAAAATVMPDASAPAASSLPRAVPTTPESAVSTQSAPRPPPQGSSAAPEPAIATSAGTGERKAAPTDAGGGAAGLKSAPRKLGEVEIALMIKRGSLFMANGNVGAARMMLQPAADAGSPVAAVALAETYDPLVLDRLGAKGGITPDVALAHAWYERARDLGSTVAPQRIEMLARVAE